MGQQREFGEASKQEADAATRAGCRHTGPRASAFYPAEDYHHNEKNPLKYKFYRWNCGRDQRLEELWGDAAGSLKGS